MKISQVSGSTNKNFIEVRQYTNSIVNISQEEEDDIRTKRCLNRLTSNDFVPK